MKKALAFWLCAALCAGLCACTPKPAQTLDARVVFVNVGKADAAVAEIGDFVAVIDTGTEESVPALLGALKTLGVEKIDALFLSHTHDDHTGGAAALCEAYRVDHLYIPYFSETKKGTSVFDTLADAYGLAVTRLKRADTVRADGAAFYVLGPLRYNEDDDNDNSLVLRLEVNGVSFLFTGDMQTAEEASLLAANINLRADVLKVGNHGNPDASSAAFLAKVGPSVAVISTDRNVDGDSASPDVLARLSDAEVYLTETYETGVMVVPSGGKVSVCALDRPETDVRGVVISAADRSTGTVTLQNTADVALDLSGCMVQSRKSGALHIFTANTVLEAHGTLTLSATGEGDLVWDEEKPLKKNDTVRLFDPYGNCLGQYDL